ncbi:ATPase GET3B isoform X2 [Coffea arabica]|uniref:ATPase GET3B isoform X2 n=1 Tax=Coffea arabica TaxID=13443 RepID=A0ABM4V5A8_COFAR
MFLICYIIQLKEKIASATSASKFVIGKGVRKQIAQAKASERENDEGARSFPGYRDNRVVKVTIPTAMAVSESSRLCASLKKEKVPVRRLIVNQVLPPSLSDCKFCAMKRKDQMHAFDMIHKDQELSSLKMVEAPVFQHSSLWGMSFGVKASLLTVPNKIGNERYQISVRPLLTTPIINSSVKQGNEDGGNYSFVAGSSCLTAVEFGKHGFLDLNICMLLTSTLSSIASVVGKSPWTECMN